MPKPIVRKVGGEENLPPMDTQRSAFSLKLEQLGNKQKDAFKALSPDAIKMHEAIRDLDRFSALPQMIDMVKTDLKKYSVSMQAASRDFQHELIQSRVTDTVDEDGNPTRSHAADRDSLNKIRSVAIALDSIGLLLSLNYQKLCSLEAEYIALESKVIDDSLLPDFDRLQADRSKAGEVEEMANEARSLSLAETPCFEDSRYSDEENSGFTTDEAKWTTVTDKPLQWSARYEFSDTVVAPNSAGAKAMVAMRIRHLIREDDVQVYPMLSHLPKLQMTLKKVVDAE